jgi:hypothetical protein
MSAGILVPFHSSPKAYLGMPIPNSHIGCPTSPNFTDLGKVSRCASMNML